MKRRNPYASSTVVAKRRRSQSSGPPRFALQKALLGLAETKTVDYVLPSGIFSSILNTWEDLCMTQISASVDKTGRIGSQISVTQFDFDGVLLNAWTSALADEYSVVRIVLSKVDNNGSATPFLSAGANINTHAAPDTIQYLDKVYYDQYIPLVGTYSTAAAAGPCPKHIKFSVKFRQPIVITYTTSGALTSNTGLFLSMISDSAAVPSPGFIQGRTRLHFKDI